ncbi:MAG: VPLPA-CTERM sorting domain-containing protein, partial [Pseudomonadota bacterium]
FFGIGISAALRNQDFSNSDGTTNIEALTASPGASLSVATSLPSDLYVFGIGGFYRFNPGAPGQNVVINYVAEFTVAAIPLPATAWLMLAGLGGLAAAARRRGLASQVAHP